MPRPRAVVAWSCGKDSAYALHVARQAGDVEILGLLTTLTEPYTRVSMHGIREALLDAQATALGLPVSKVWIPAPCPNTTYEARMGAALARLRQEEGVDTVIFGDLFLEDIRAYREAQLARAGMSARFPLWGRDTRVLARQMVAEGLRAVLTCVDPRRLPDTFAGRTFDGDLLADLPAGVDPCGEHGEFHTLVTAGPMLRAPLAVDVGDVVTREGFCFADVRPARSPQP